MSRLGIFCMYDSEGVVDNYILYLLNEIKKVVEHLTVVCNGELSDSGKNLLKNFTDDITVRSNTGFDMEAWKQGILNNEKNLSDYDEIILFNDSFYGPFYPLEEIFSEMNEKYSDADFWGITIQGQSEDTFGACPYGYLPEHIQSYFLVVREKMFHSEHFIKYWKESEEAKNFYDAVTRHEVCFTKIFSDFGFKYAVYCDTRELEKNYDVHINHYLLSTEKLLKDYHCPILKKKVFQMSRPKYILDNCGDGPRKSLEFIKNHTSYDTNLIFQNQLRLQNIAVIKSSLGLDYIFPTQKNIYSNEINYDKVVVVAHLYYEDLFSKCVEYLCNTPKNIFLIVTVSDEQKKLLAEKLLKISGRKYEVRIVSARGRDLSALFVGCADLFEKFEYLCFVHDKKSIRSGKSMTVGDAFFRMLWENTLASENYVQNILSTFEDEPQLGLLVPPPPHHGEYQFFINDYWTSVCFERALKLADRLNIPKKFLNRKLSPLSIGSVFWCRTKALKKIIDAKITLEEFPAEPMPDDGTLSHAMERIFPFVAQSAGFYTGWLMTSDFAKDELENYICFASNLKMKFIQSLAAFVKMKVPQKYWKYLQPFKKMLYKMGLKI